MYYIQNVTSFFSGGEPGARGRNLLIKPSGDVVDLEGKECVQVDPCVRQREGREWRGRAVEGRWMMNCAFLSQDVFLLQTPGGGGYGDSSEEKEEEVGLPHKKIHRFASTVSVAFTR